jgi:hypothetical protein
MRASCEQTVGWVLLCVFVLILLKAFIFLLAFFSFYLLKNSQKFYVFNVTAIDGLI